MKKWLLVICTLSVAAIGSIYLLIPSMAVISRVVVTNCKANAAFPILSKESNWDKWWPTDGGGDRPSYHIRQISYNVVNIRILPANGAGGPAEGYESRLSIIPLGSLDSILLRWECTVPTGSNPVQRVRQYLEARKMAGNMSKILSSLSEFLGKKVNVYGVAIREGSTNDSFLATTKSVLPVYPSTADIYGMLHKVRDYLEQEGAKQTGYPMVNVTPVNTRKDSFQVMVAIPIDKSLPGKGNIYFRRLVPGKYLIGDVKGGEYAINNALAGFQNYILDYQRTIMAIPFQSFITDRIQQPDTSRWETRIYYPIF